MVNAQTGKPGQTLIDGIDRADISLVDGDANMFLNISELHDPDGIQTSHTSSRFTLSGLNFDKTLTANYKQSRSIMRMQRERKILLTLRLM